MTSYVGVASAGVPAFAGTSATTAAAVSGITVGTGYTGVYGESNAANAAATAGVAKGSNAIGLFGTGLATGGYGMYASGNKYGGYALAGALGGYGLYAQATYIDPNLTFPNTAAVFADGWSTGLKAQGSVYGVYAWGNSGASITGYFDGGGIVGGSGKAGYFLGRCEAHDGDLAHSGAGAKTFQIDHPLDLENKVLVHACIESNEQKNVYDGVVTADGSGVANVTLPAYFEHLNTSFRYQLTALGGSAPDLHVASEVKGNVFTIAGAKPGQKVSWQITGVRHDPTSQLVPFKAERDKLDEEKGLFLSPEAHGQPEEKGIMHKHKAFKTSHKNDSPPQLPSLVDKTP